MASKSIIEEWRDIPGYEGRYQISNLGNIRSLPYVRYQESSHPGVMMHKHHPGKKMTPTDNGHGYMIIGLRYGAKRKNFYIHRLVAEAFIPNPDNLPEINHIDYDRSNNVFWNLEWTTRIGNLEWSNDRMCKPKPNAKLTNIGMRYISEKNGKYRVNIYNKRNGFRFERYCNTLEEAIAERDGFIHGKEYFAKR